MGYSAYGSVAAVGLIAIVVAGTAIDRGMNYQAAKASVFMIDRTCSFVETATGGDGRKISRTTSGDCGSTDEWAMVREKRNKVVDGKAIVKVSYTAPQDGSQRTSELHYDGRDDAFYELKAGDQIDILVSNDDPSKIIEG